MGQALSIAKGVSGVQRVVNEMSVNSSASEEASGPFQLASGTNEIEAQPAYSMPEAPQPELSSPELVEPVVGPAVGIESPREAIPARRVAQRMTRPMEPAELSAPNGVVPAIPQYSGEQGMDRAAADQQTAQQIAGQFRSGGKLKNYRIGVTVQDGTARLNGTVTNKQQMAQAVNIAKQTRGVTNVINELTLGQPAANNSVQQAGYAPGVPARPAGYEGMAAENMNANAAMGAYNDAGPHGAPIPAYGFGPGSPAPAHYDEPNMPNHAWPSYAAYPNYAGVTYPRQYSPTAWPYIGPFYPYPQVPLGWRKVTLEWDDGWWFLDFDDKNW
jgi:osmotically-inducible protein OsmY